LVARFSKSEKTKLDFRRGMTTGAVWILFLIYPSVSNKIFQTYSCVDFEDGSSVLRADYTISCLDPNRTGWLALASIMIVVYPLGVPLFFYWLLHRHVTKLNPPGTDVDTIVEKRALDPDIAHLKVLFYAYEPLFWYWEIVELFRKLMVTSIAAFFLEGTATQIVLTLLISMFFLGVMSSYRPYLEDDDDFLASLSHWGLILTLLAGILYKLNVSETDGYSSDVYTVLVYISLITPMAAAVYSAFTKIFPGVSIKDIFEKYLVSADDRAKLEARKKTKRPSQLLVHESEVNELRAADREGGSEYAGVKASATLNEGALPHQVAPNDEMKTKGQFEVTAAGV